ncbi:MAG: hypothetical protein ACLFNK_04685 [Candidatus Woesearchaeota archaeon]
MPATLEKNVKKIDRNVKKTEKELMREYHEIVILTKLIDRFAKEDNEKKREKIRRLIIKETRRLNRDERYFDKDIIHQVGDFYSLTEQLEEHYEKKSEVRNIYGAVEPLLKQLTTFKDKLLMWLSQEGELDKIIKSEELEEAKEIINDILNDIKGAYMDEEHLKSILDAIEVKLSENSGGSQSKSDDYGLGDTVIRKFNYPRRLVNHVYVYLPEICEKNGARLGGNKKEGSVPGWNPEYFPPYTMESHKVRDGDKRVLFEVIGRSRYNMKPIATNNNGRKQYAGMHSSNVAVPAKDLRRVSEKEEIYYNGDHGVQKAA